MIVDCYKIFMIKQFCTSTEIGYDMEVMTECLRAARIFTLCAYAQQGYAFSHVRLCICIYIYIYMYVNKKQAV